MAPLDHRGRAGAIEGQKVKTFFGPYKSKFGKKYKKNIKNQCRLVCLVKKISLLLFPVQFIFFIFSSVLYQLHGPVRTPNQSCYSARSSSICSIRTASLSDPIILSDLYAFYPRACVCQPARVCDFQMNKTIYKDRGSRCLFATLILVSVFILFAVHMSIRICFLLQREENWRQIDILCNSLLNFARNFHIQDMTFFGQDSFYSLRDLTPSFYHPNFASYSHASVRWVEKKSPFLFSHFCSNN